MILTLWNWAISIAVERKNQNPGPLVLSINIHNHGTTITSFTEPTKAAALLTMATAQEFSDRFSVIRTTWSQGDVEEWEDLAAELRKSGTSSSPELEAMIEVGSKKIVEAIPYDFGRDVQ